MSLTKIEWCDFTWNPWIGCEKVSPGCLRCYAERLAKTRLAGMLRQYALASGRYYATTSGLGEDSIPVWGKGSVRRPASEKVWHDPLRWDAAVHEGRFRQCACGHRELRKRTDRGWAENSSRCSAPGCQAGSGESEADRPTVFSLSLGDWLDPEVPTAWRLRMLEIIYQAQWLDFLLLTKRPQHFFDLLQVVLEHPRHEPNDGFKSWLGRWVCYGVAPANVALGVSVEDQERWDERVPILKRTPTMMRFVSAEPLLGELDLRLAGDAHRVDWVIVGGETGPGAVHTTEESVRSVVWQCQAALVPVFVKQMGEAWANLVPGRERRGKAMAEWPEAVRVRQFPSRWMARCLWASGQLTQQSRKG